MDDLHKGKDRKQDTSGSLSQDTDIHSSRLRCVQFPEIKYKHKCNTHFQAIIDNIYDSEDLFLLLMCLPVHPQPVIFLPVQNRFSRTDDK